MNVANGGMSKRFPRAYFESIGSTRNQSCFGVPGLPGRTYDQNDVPHPTLYDGNARMLPTAAAGPRVDG